MLFSPRSNSSSASGSSRLSMWTSRDAGTTLMKTSFPHSANISCVGHYCCIYYWYFFPRYIYIYFILSNLFIQLSFVARSFIHSSQPFFVHLFIRYYFFLYIISPFVMSLLLLFATRYSFDSTASTTTTSSTSTRTPSPSMWTTRRRGCSTGATSTCPIRWRASSLSRFRACFYYCYYYFFLFSFIFYFLFFHFLIFIFIFIFHSYFYLFLFYIFLFLFDCFFVWLFFCSQIKPKGNSQR